MMGLALSYAAPNAKALGFTLEETAAAIGVLANNGLRGERAGTVLREAFVQLQQPTSKLSEALADFEWGGMMVGYWQFGAKFNLGAGWVGAHYSSHNKRLCVNFVPFFTIWAVAPWGVRPQ